MEGPAVAPERIWLKQTGVVALGVFLAAAMVVLGIWQLEVYQRQGNETANRRAEAAPVALSTVAPPGGAVDDGYGRRVSFTGTYDPTLQVIVPTDGAYRVLTGLKQADGSIVPVVRGIEATPDQPVPPAGHGHADRRAAALRGALGLHRDAARRADRVRAAAHARADLAGTVRQRLRHPRHGRLRRRGPRATAVDLPEAQGRLRNGAYALQWWVFAAFALGMSIRVARDIGRLEERDLEAYV